MSHQESSEMLYRYVAGRLGQERSRALERHLGECGRCREDLAEIREQSEAIRIYSDELSKAPAALWRERLREGALPPQDAEASGRRGAKSWLPAINRSLAPFAAGAVAASLMFLLFWPSPGALPVVAQVERLLPPQRSAAKVVTLPPAATVLVLDLRSSQPDGCRLQRRHEEQWATISEHSPLTTEAASTVSIPRSRLESGDYRLCCGEAQAGEADCRPFRLEMP